MLSVLQSVNDTASIQDDSVMGSLSSPLCDDMLNVLSSPVGCVCTAASNTLRLVRDVFYFFQTPFHIKVLCFSFVVTFSLISYRSDATLLVLSVTSVFSFLIAYVCRLLGTLGLAPACDLIGSPGHSICIPCWAVLLKFRFLVGGYGFTVL